MEMLIIVIRLKMANRFGMDYSPLELTDEQRQNEHAIITSIIPEVIMPVQSTDSTQSTTQSVATQSGTQPTIQSVTPDTSATQKKHKYSVKEGSMSDMRIKRMRRLREKRALQ